MSRINKIRDTVWAQVFALRFAARRNVEYVRETPEGFRVQYRDDADADDARDEADRAVAALGTPDHLPEGP